MSGEEIKYLPQHFISYGDSKFKNSKNRIKREAENFGAFTSIEVNGPEDLDLEFKRKFNYVLSHSKGGGYWIWKYFLINKKLNEIKDGEFIIYCDAGCTINLSGKERYFEYLDLLNKSKFGVMSFPLSPLKEGACMEKFWTIKEIFNYFNVDIDSEIANTSQLCATILIFKKNKHSIKILNEYLKILESDQKLITDYYNGSQHSFFKDARQDQSIWSVIRKVHGSHVIPLDETYFCVNDKPYFWGNSEALKCPFWTTRIKN